MSITPGVTNLPVPSIVVAPAGAATLWPTATTLPSANSTWPPSITSVCPVMNDDASLARNTAGPAISSALAQRPIGMVAVSPA